MRERQYIAIDLKSFYASVECVDRGLNPLDACLVVADESRTDKTICLAVSPALKAYGVPGRPRLFEVKQILRDVNRRRGRAGQSTSGAELAANPDLTVDFIVAPPRMRRYVEYSTRIYGIYLHHIAAEDVYVYSIDEVFIDATDYLETYRVTAHELAMRIIHDVLAQTGITATAGIGTNMYLCKIAMDIVAKKMAPDADGVRIAELDEMSYRHKLWSHEPLTDFWRVGRGIVRRLEAVGIRTMGDIARCSICNEDWLYSQFGVNAELLIDHAWGWEPVTMSQVKAYHPETHSISSGQVLHEAYTFAKARNVVQEMADEVALELVDKGLMTDQITLTIGYDVENLLNNEIRMKYFGKVTVDYYGRQIPYHSHGTANFDSYTSSSAQITGRVCELFDRIANPILLVRRITLSINRLQSKELIMGAPVRPLQLDLFSDYEAVKRRKRLDEARKAKEQRRQRSILLLRKQFGKNVILKGINYADGATQRDRNGQIGGHKA